MCRASCLLLVGSLAACTAEPDSEAASDESRASVVAGTLQNARLDEASGLARSQRYPNVLWVANDDGPSVLYAIDDTGRDLGRVSIKDASNRNWEDLASFTLDETPYLVAADIGDNDAERKDVRLYIIEEPEAGDDKVDVAWEVEFSYPEGPRDAEAIAVDVENREVLVLTKRDLPALLYSVPLQPGTGKRQTARRVAVVDTLPQPGRSDVEFAPRTDDWHWQPTSMDVNQGGSSAVVLTYGGVYLYFKQDGASWSDTFRRRPFVVSRTGNRRAESIAFDASGDYVFITLEQRNAPLYRLQLGGGPQE